MNRPLPSAPGAILLLTRLHARRLLNRMGVRMGRRLGGNRIAGALLAVFLGGLVMVNTAAMTYRLLSTLPRGSLATGLGGVLLLMACWKLCVALGSGNQDLGKVESGDEWLFTLPAPARALCLAQVFAYAVIDPVGWIVVLPFLFVVFRAAWLGAMAVPLAVGGAIYIAFVVGCCTNIIETFLRKTFSPARLKNLQAVFSLVGIAFFFMLLALTRPGIARGSLATYGLHASHAILWNPFSVPLLFFSRDVPGWLAAVALCAYALGFMAAAVWVFERMTLDGLIATTAVYEGSRGGTGAPSRRLMFRGIIGKDVRLLMRDRNFLVQTLVTPLVFLGYQLMFNAGLFKAAMSDFTRSSTYAYGLGAYMLLSTAFSVLAVEGNSLWMLYTFPRPLHAILFEKTLLWTGFALLYTVCALSYCAWGGHAVSAAALSQAVMVIAGIIVYSFIAAAIGVLATNPLKMASIRRRYRPGMVYFYMILAGLYGYTLYTGSKLAQAVALLAAIALSFALWGRVRKRLPYLLDASI